MKILFVTRKFPPSTGGMETAAFELYSALSAKNKVSLVKWGGSNKWLPLMYPLLFVSAVFKAVVARPDVIYLQDGVMAPLGWLVKKLSRRPTVITVHGLEVTHGGSLYKRLVMPFIGRQDCIVAVSEATKKQVENIFPRARTEVVNNGIKDSFFLGTDRKAQLAELAEDSGLDPRVLAKSKVLYTNGRLVKRKGTVWFIENVMPGLIKRYRGNIFYLISGKGPQQKNIETMIRKTGLGKNVKLLGRVSDKTLKLLYNGADIFVMPNITVENDMEGFGLVALEAASAGTTVIASNSEGVVDAIVDGKNGFHAQIHDPDSFVKKILQELDKPSLPEDKIRKFTLQNFSWETTASAYEKIMKNL